MNKDILIINGIKYIRVEEEENKQNLKLYDVVKYNNFEWYVIKTNNNEVRLLLKETLDNEEMEQIFGEELDEDKDIYFNKENNFDWKDSIIRKGLNEVFINKFNKEELNIMHTNYDESKGSKDYIKLLTIREVEKLPEEIRKSDRDYWTMSPSYFRSWHGDAYVWCVFGGGYLYDFYWTALTLGVRPVISLKSEYLINSQN